MIQYIFHIFQISFSLFVPLSQKFIQSGFPLVSIVFGNRRTSKEILYFIYVYIFLSIFYLSRTRFISMKFQNSQLSYTYIDIYVYLCVCAHIYIYIYICKNIRIHIHVCIYPTPLDVQDVTQGQFLADFNWFKFRIFFRVNWLPYLG